jgi:hypothetical protein
MANAHVIQTHADPILRLNRLANIYHVAVPNVFKSLPPRPLYCGVLFTKGDKAASFFSTVKTTQHDALY